MSFVLLHDMVYQPKGAVAAVDVPADDVLPDLPAAQDDDPNATTPTAAALRITNGSRSVRAGATGRIRRAPQTKKKGTSA